MYELKRECIKFDVTIYKSKDISDLYKYMQETIKRNNYKVTYLTDINMNTVWDTGKAAYYISKTKVKK